MSSLLENLDSQARLLMYLADELAPEDRAQVERQLRDDPTFTQELEQLRQMQDATHSAFIAADAGQKFPMTRDTAVRRVSRAMKQWQVDRAHRSLDNAPVRRPFHIPWWGYASGVAAAIIIGVIVWSGSLPEAGNHAPTAEQIQKEHDTLAENFGDGFSQDVESFRNSRRARFMLLSRDTSDNVMDDVFMQVDQ
ncbi:MAG TPA: hypothetical protein VF669_22260 [Tepidisphaeraceae bacterium]|jgi:anti-sigma factor RsiW